MVNLTFILPRLAPGNAAQIIGSGAGLNAPQAVQAITQRLGLDKPLSVQYYLYMKGIFFTWPPSFGYSYQFFPLDVTTLFASRIGWTLLLIFTSFTLSTAIALGLGRITALRRGKIAELISLYGSIFLQSTPVFWTAMVLLWVFSVSLKWFPIFGAYDPNAGTGTSYAISVIWHMVLPVLAMTASIFGQSYMVLRGTMQEVLNSDYVTAAKTRGLRDKSIASGYILRNSMLPLVSLLAFSLAGLISRVILVEAVFGYPGVGDLLVDGILVHDYPVIEGAFFYLTLIVLVGGIVGDLVLVRLDPRLRR